MKTWTIIEIVKWTTDFFKQKNIETAKLDAELIVSKVLNKKRLDLYLNFDKPLSPEEKTEIRNLVVKRANREPLQYIFGNTEFYNLNLKVTTDVLIPRPETEQLVDKIVNFEEPKSDKILDLCTGSGAIALSLKLNYTNATVIGSDISKKAIEIAKTNAENNNLDVEFIVSDLFENIEDKFDMIVSNPPYISEEDYLKLEPELTKYEPKLALVAENKGLAIYEKILTEVAEYLNDNGIVWLEIGYNQAESINTIAKANGFNNIQVFKDYNNFDRMVRLQK